MSYVSTAIGERLRCIRAGRGLSLDEAARLTGVSKPMLGQIERGQSSPTVGTLWKIATGLKTPLSTFLEDQKDAYTVVDALRDDPVLEDSGRMRAYPLFAYDPLRSVETFYIEFDPGCRHVSAPHQDGVEEHLFVLEGRLRLILRGEEIVVKEKQSIRFRADSAHEYGNPFDTLCTVYNIIFYPG